MPDRSLSAEPSVLAPLERSLADAPLVRAWSEFVDSAPTPFTIPGHKRRAGRLSPALGRLLDPDVPLYGGLDTVKLERGALARAEGLAAELWGADWCRFSTCGSTHANQALCLALGRPGDRVIVTRTAHRSTLMGLVLSGLEPVWVAAEIDERLGVPVGMSVPSLTDAIARHPDAVGVLCVEPGYVGTMSDLPRIVEVAHRAGLPVVVDQAWGAHLGFAAGYPDHALAAGADAAVLSVHKTLPAFSQGSIAMARTERLDPDRLERAFEACHTTSPAGAILASIDASRALLASSSGADLLAQLAALVAQARSLTARLGLPALDPAAFGPGRFDPAKLVLRAAPGGLSGIDVERELITRGVAVEMADRDMIIPLVSLLDDAQSMQRLVEGLAAAAGPAPRVPRPTAVAPQWRHEAPLRMTPRSAFFAVHRSCPLDDAIGAVCSELVAPYPPGIPVLVPGEEITAASVAALRAAARTGARIAYAADPTLATVQIVADPH